MSGEHNPVWPGFPFTLDFELAADYLPAGAVLRISLSPQGQTPATAVDIQLTSPAAGFKRMSMSKEQTAQFRAPGMLWGDFVIRHADGSERPMNLRLGIPVEKPLTPATP